MISGEAETAMKKAKKNGKDARLFLFQIVGDFMENIGRLANHAVACKNNSVVVYDAAEV